MIAEMIAARVGTDATLTAVRPVTLTREDVYPCAIYETVSMSNKSSLNGCPSSRWDATIRVYFCAVGYDELNAIAERGKAALVGYVEQGTAYKIKRVELVDEGDVGQETSEGGQAFYVKSIDLRIIAGKLTP